MRILKAKFVNFAGFYTGLGLKTFEIDFSKSADEPITMLFGKNRSGKTTLISVLHPFPSSLDNRKQIIMEGEDGSKDIIFKKDDGSVFKTTIHYLWNANDARHETKCFLYKLEGDKWNNLNSSGKIKSYGDCVEDNLGVTEDYFTVGRIGGIANFVDLSKSDRKRFIGQFLPAIDPYLNFHKKASEQFTALRRQMATFKDELTKLSPKELCKVSIENLEGNIKDKDDLLEGYNKDYGSCKGAIDKILAETDASIPELRIFARTGKNPVEDKIADLEKIYNIQAAEIPDGFSLESADEEIDSLLPELDKAKESRTTHSVQMNNAKTGLNEAEDTRDKAEAKLKTLEDTRSSVEKLNDLTAELTVKMEEQSKVMTERYTDIKFKKFNTYGAGELAILKRDTIDANTLLSNIRDQLNSYGLTDTDLTDKSVVTKTLFDTKTALKALEEKRAKMITIAADIKFAESQSKLEEVLLKRPASCKNDSCPFIAAALEAKGSTVRLAALRKAQEEFASLDRDSLENEATYLNNKITFLSSCGDIFENFRKELNKKLSLRLISKIQLLNDPSIYLKYLKCSEDELFDLFDISEIEDYVNARIEYETTRTSLANAKLELKSIGNEADAIASAKEMFEKADAKVTELTNTFNEEKEGFTVADEAVNNLDAEITKIKNTKKAFVILEEKKKEIDELRAKSEKMKQYLEDIATNRAQMVELTAKINQEKQEKENLEGQLNDFRFQQQKRVDLEASIAKIQDEYNAVDAVKTACDQTKGIPLYLIDTYLEEIREKANHLLQITFNGDLLIGDFVITEKDFSIPIIKSNGTVLEDCKLGSGAEQSFVKQALSLAILDKAINNSYNIVYLDEVDGVLDEHNRTGFVKMLRRQILDLKIEQCFVISHNREFMQEPCNLILLKNHGIETKNESIMANKTIIYNFEA